MDIEEISPLDLAAQNKSMETLDAILEFNSGNIWTFVRQWFII